MLKKTCCFFSIIIIILLIGLYAKTHISNSLSASLDSTEEIISSTTEFMDEEKQSQQNPEMYSHISVSRSSGPGKEFLTVPLYYQQDYEDIFSSKTTISASLITCLSMLESYYTADYVTPIEYTKAHNIKNKNSSELINDFAENNERNITKLSFDAETLANYLINERREVLVQISHPSIYGTPSSFIIVTTTSADGKLYVRDPNHTNIDSYASFASNDEPLYDPTMFCEQASSSSYMYIFTEKPKGEK